MSFYVIPFFPSPNFLFLFYYFLVVIVSFFQIKLGKKRISFTLSHVAQLGVNTKLDLALVPSYFMDRICLLEFKGRASIISFFNFLPPHNIAHRKCDIDAIWKLSLTVGIWGIPAGRQ